MESEFLLMKEEVAVLKAKLEEKEVKIANLHLQNEAIQEILKQ